MICLLDAYEIKESLESSKYYAECGAILMSLQLIKMNDYKS